MHANSHYSQEVPSIRPPSERPMQDPYRNLPDQLAISAIRTIFVALRVGAKYSGDGPFNRILPLSFVICVEIQTCSYWTALEGVRTLPFLPQHPFLPVLHWFRRSLYGHPFQATTHAVIQILTRLVNNLCCYYYYSKSISGMKQHRCYINTVALESKLSFWICTPSIFLDSATALTTLNCLSASVSRRPETARFSGRCVFSQTESLLGTKPEFLKPVKSCQSWAHRESWHPCHQGSWKRRGV